VRADELLAGGEAVLLDGGEVLLTAALLDDGGGKLEAPSVQRMALAYGCA